MVTPKDKDQNKDAVADTGQTPEQKENETLRKQIEEMKAMMDQLVKAQKEQESTISTLGAEGGGDVDRYKQIEVMSLVNGGLNLRGNNSQLHRFARFGATKTLTFEEVRAMYNNHPTSFEGGSLYIKDEDVVKSLDLTESYKNILDKTALENLIKLPADQIKDFIKDTATRTQKETIVENAVNGFVNGDAKYMDMNKLKAIGEAVNKDVISLATEKATSGNE